MALDFPASPTNGQTFGNYIYDTSIPGWRNVNSGEGVGLQFKSGLIPIVPTSVSVGSGSATVGTDGTVTFTGASYVALVNAFPTTYKTFRIIWTTTANTATAYAWFRFATSGTQTTSGLWYGGQSWTSQSGAVSGWGSTTAGPDLTMNQTLGTGYNSLNTVSDVLVSKVDNGLRVLNTSSGFAGDQASFISGGFLWNQSNTTFDGFRVSASSGTFTGTIKVYGYN